MTSNFKKGAGQQQYLYLGATAAILTVKQGMVESVSRLGMNGLTPFL